MQSLQTLLSKKQIRIFIVNDTDALADTFEGHFVVLAFNDVKCFFGENSQKNDNFAAFLENFQKKLSSEASFRRSHVKL